MAEDLVKRLRDAAQNFRESECPDDHDIETVTRSADRIERLEERCEAYKGQVKAGSDRIEALEAENAGLRADKEHMDWLEAHEVQIWAKTDGISELVIYAQPSQKRPRPNKLRERIIAARSALSGKGA